jgi:hypothetical protein
MLFSLQVFLGQSGVRDVEGCELPRLVYVSREKRPGFEHHKKAGAMNALVSDGCWMTCIFLTSMDRLFLFCYMSYLTFNMWPRTNKLCLFFYDCNRCGSLQFCQMPLIFWMLIVTIILTIAEHLEKPCVSWWIQHQGKKFVMCSFLNDLMALIVMIDTQIGTLYSLMYVYFAFLHLLFCYDVIDYDGKANLLIENR